jgi:hypothetical protein
VAAPVGISEPGKAAGANRPSWSCWRGYRSLLALGLHGSLGPSHVALLLEGASLFNGLGIHGAWSETRAAGLSCVHFGGIGFVGKVILQVLLHFIVEIRGLASGLGTKIFQMRRLGRTETGLFCFSGHTLLSSLFFALPFGVLLQFVKKTAVRAAFHRNAELRLYASTALYFVSAF